MTVDAALSETSENPVQNKTIALALNELHGSMDDMVEMLDNMIMLRTELTVDTTQDAWSGANWDELIAAAKNGRAVSLGVDGADAQTVLLHYDELANSAEIKIIETEPKIYYYSTLAGAVSDSNAGTVGTNEDAAQGTAVASLYADENGVPVVTLLQNTTITSGVIVKRNSVIDLNGHKITANFGNPSGHSYAIFIYPECSLRILGQTLGSEIESNSGTGNTVSLLYNYQGSYLEVIGGNYTVNAAETNIGVCVQNYGNLFLKDATINATAKNVDGISSGGSGTSGQNNIIKNTSIRVNGANSTTGINVQSSNETYVSNCQIIAESDAEAGKTYGIKLDNTTGAIIIQNTEITADSSYAHDGTKYTVLSSGIYIGSQCSYSLLQNCVAKGTHSSASIYSKTDIIGGYYSSAGHGVYFTGADTEYRIKDATLDDLYVGTHSNTNMNHVGAYIGGFSSATNIKVYADNVTVSGSNYSWVLKGSTGEHDNALFISNSDINNKTIRIDDDETLKLYLGEGNTFDADDTTRPANVVETGADYTFTPTATEISYSGQPVTGSLTERDPGSVAIREISLKSSGGAVVTDYALVQSAAVSAAISTAVAGKANTADLATVATSGSYNDLSNKPTIPSLSGYATETWVTNKGYQTAAQVQTAISSGSVTSVNGKTGAVVLNAEDVGGAQESLKLTATPTAGPSGATLMSGTWSGATWEEVVAAVLASRLIQVDVATIGTITLLYNMGSATNASSNAFVYNVGGVLYNVFVELYLSGNNNVFDLSIINAHTKTVNITSTTPTIKPQANTIYQCGEVASLTISNPPATGAYSIVFTSGSTPTDLSIDPAIKMPDGFSVEANKRYEINVLNNWAVVGSWAVSV